MNWKAYWNKVSEGNSFSSMGRDSYSTQELFIYINSICQSFKKFKVDDILLDVGGGKGYLSMAFSPYVKSVTLIDFSDAMIKKASILTSEFKNIEVFEDRLPNLEKIQFQKKVFSKILIGSVIQYLNNYDEIETSFCNLIKLSDVKGKILFTHNPDITKKQSFIDSYYMLNWPKQKLKSAIDFEKNDRFWFDFEILKEIAHSVGFKKCERISIPTNLFQSSHMFDFMLYK